MYFSLPISAEHTALNRCPWRMRFVTSTGSEKDERQKTSFLLVVAVLLEIINRMQGSFPL